MWTINNKGIITDTFYNDVIISTKMDSKYYLETKYDYNIMDNVGSQCHCFTYFKLHQKCISSIICRVGKYVMA